ncbi:MAG: acyltransferase [Salinibacterium sp.]|nr:acyltransferase [Salinibacterium sp.]
MTSLGRHTHRPQLVAGEVRADIQGLRAIAVVLVLAFHLWPDRLGGGFVGVDVFFVISGFLITAHLVRQPPRSVSDVTRFWARRLRRLLPASLLVIAATVIAGVVFFPVTRLAPLATDALASVFYAENWRLAVSSIDYLAARAPASPLQHYWSLGVEEQFYLIWPVLIGLLLLARRTRWLVVGVTATVILSLAVSIAWTATDPSVAYFATPARLWQLASGGLLAILLPLLPRSAAGIRAIVAWLGILLIAVSALWFTAATPFPGVAAVLPVAGALLVLGADSSDARFSPGAVLRLRPIQFVGDTSYSIYLWHFPLVVFATSLLGGHLTIAPKVAIVVATLGLAWLTRMFIEDPARRSVWLRPVRRTFGTAGVATIIALALTFAPTLRIASVEAKADSERAQIAAANAGCFGAEALATLGCPVSAGTSTIPSPERAIDDFSVAYADGCLVPTPYRDVTTCQYGVRDHPSYRIALVGNSHAAQWLPALQELAGDRSLSITTYLAVGCMPTGATLVIDSPQGCLDWGKRVVEQTAAGGFDLIVVSAAPVFAVAAVAPEAQFQAKVDGYTSVLTAWADTPVLVIRDAPLPGFDIPECVATKGLGECDGSRDTWVTPDPLAVAAQRLAQPGLSSVDLENLFCSDLTCYSVIGGVLVYVDYSHFGSTFARTLAPYLAPALDSALGR